jgi:PAS domain S-box-containing protein
MQRNTTQARAEDHAVAHLAAIVMHAHDAIISKTLDGTVVSWNPAAERMFGYSAAEIIGKSIVAIIPPERLHEEDEILGRLRRGEIIDHFETERVRKDGQRIPISLTISPIRRADGAIIGASKIARDISEKKRIEQERDLLLLREQEARAEAEAANRAKDDFLAVLSHELRTPLSTIVTGARVLRNITRHDETANRTREAIERQASHLSAMLEDLLDFKRIVSRTIVLDPRPCDLGEVVRECITALKETGRFKDHALAVDLKPVQVNADVVRLNQVLVNPDRQRFEVHPAWRFNPSLRQGGGHRRRVPSRGHGDRHQRRRALSDLRLIRARRHLDGACPQRARRGFGSGPPSRRASRWDGAGVERRPREGQHIHRATAPTRGISFIVSLRRVIRRDG